MRRSKKMAAKKTTKTVEEAVTPIENVEVIETVNVEEAVAESIAPAKPARKIIIAKTSVPFRKFPTLLQAHVVSKMPVGTAYEIVMEVKNGAGAFYKLNNNMYITQRGNYTIQ